MVTIKDLAAQLGVSPSTITRALADSRRISAKTKERVHKAAREMGYVADTAAKTMRSRQSTLIGLIIPDIENSFYALIAKAFSEVCNQHGFQLMLAVSEDDDVVEERHVSALVSARSAGIAIVPTPLITPRSLSLLNGRNMAQLIRRDDRLVSDWYGIEDDSAIENAVTYLLERNHTRIGFIGGTDDFTSGQARFHGYTTALAKAGIPQDPDLVFRGPPRVSFAYDAANQLHNFRQPPTAIIAAGAGLSEGLLNAATGWDDNSNTEPNSQMSLIGFSDCPAFRWWKGTGLTTVDLPIHEIAKDLCLGLIRGAKETGEMLRTRESHSYKSRLIPRGSVTPRIEKG